MMLNHGSDRRVPQHRRTQWAQPKPVVAPAFDQLQRGRSKQQTLGHRGRQITRVPATIEGVSGPSANTWNKRSRTQASSVCV
jgi:hypothetical protein